jgi:hypothetical protein
MMENYTEMYARIGVVNKDRGVKGVAERKLQIIEQNLEALNSLLRQAEREFVQREFFKGGLVNEHYVALSKRRKGFIGELQVQKRQCISTLIEPEVVPAKVYWFSGAGH